MGTGDLRDDALTRNLSRRSMAIIGLLASLAFGSLGIFWLQTRSIESTASVLNVSGRQRMLSQRTALLAECLVQPLPTSEQQVCRRELLQLAEQLAVAHRGLLEGDPDLGLPSTLPPEVHRLYFDPPVALDGQVKAYLNALRQLAEEPSLQRDNVHFSEVRRIAVEGTLLAAFDAVVSAFQTLEERKVARLERAQGVVFVLTLLAILIMQRRVVRPMAARVASHLRQLALREEVLQSLRERLAHMNRLGTMGEMAAGIAHEINQPLSAITTYAQACHHALAAGTSPRHQIAEILDKISRQAHRASEVIRRVRSLVAPQGVERRPSDLVATLTEAVALAETEARQREQSIETRFVDLLPVNIDRIQIQQVLLNLIRNGLDATAAAGRNDPMVVGCSQLDNARVEVFVQDCGHGVPQEESGEIFEPFFTTKDGGMGMGLSICRSIVEAHGGQLWFTSKPGQGTEFRFSLPRAPSKG